MAQCYFGIAGWSYPDWVGSVYPSDQPRGAYHPLAILLPYIDAVEVNVTYYRPVGRRTVQGWIRRIRDRADFAVTAKLWQRFTHDEPNWTEEEVRTFLDGLAPLTEAPQFKGFLAQFPYRFHNDPAAREHLERLADAFAGYRLFCEFRHRSWDRPEIQAWMRDRHLLWVTIDQPLVGARALPLRPYVTNDWAYLRLHGRNVRDWFRADADRDQRYNYMYTMDELQDIWQKFQPALERSRGALVVANNHFAGKGLANVLQLKSLFTGQKVPAPPGLVRAYPELKAWVEPVNPPGPWFV